MAQMDGTVIVFRRCSKDAGLQESTLSDPRMTMGFGHFSHTFVLQIIYSGGERWSYVLH